MEARHYTLLANNHVQCNLCPHSCLIPSGQCGDCQARCNEKGILLAKTYNRVCNLTTETLGTIPISFHDEYSSSQKILSLGAFGCNMTCAYCRNNHVAQNKFPSQNLEKEDLVNRFKNLKTQGIIGVNYTFNEPIVAMEFVYDCARAIQAEGGINVIDTNAFMMPNLFADFIEPLDILNIDLKGFDDDYYIEYCGALYGPVWENIQIAIQRKKHVEISIVIVAGKNDQPDKFEKGVQALSTLSPQVGLHIIGMQPDYLLKEAGTPSPASLADLKKIAEKYLMNVEINTLS